MLNRDDIAHEYAKELLKQNRTLQIEDVSSISFDLADAMIAEAKKRTDKECPAILSDWISVEDRLPKAQTLVITYGEDLYQKCRFSYGDFWIEEMNGNFIVDNVTHWQPLPQAPKKVK